MTALRSMMNAIWISVKENINCVSRIRDVVPIPRKRIQETCNQDPLLEPNSTHYYIRNRFHELQVGDPSRNIIEKIYRASSSNPAKVKRVVKVNNPLEILTKFEKYRETVMVSSNHPRGIVDGYELLQFYGTTITCNNNTPPMSQLCRDPSCRLCRLIQSGFTTPYNKIYGIRVSKSSEEMSENNFKVLVGKNVKKAVILCRTIAGHGAVEDHGFNSSMLLTNPAAILPCFVIVLH